MINNFSIDDTIIEKVVFGRIEPKIYAFETDTIPRYLKVTALRIYERPT